MDGTLEAMNDCLNGSEFDIIDHKIIPDEPLQIEETILNMADFQYVDLVITSGGTGLSSRDITPDVTKKLVEKEIPGISEILRAESYRITPYGPLSRGVAGTRKRSLIINLPGSPRAVSESMRILIPMLDHAIEMLQGGPKDCASI